MKWLVDLEIQLEQFIRPELEDSLTFVREAMERLSAELPDDEPENEAPPSAHG